MVDPAGDKINEVTAAAKADGLIGDDPNPPAPAPNAIGETEFETVAHYRHGSPSRGWVDHHVEWKEEHAVHRVSLDTGETLKVEGDPEVVRKVAEHFEGEKDIPIPDDEGDD